MQYLGARGYILSYPYVTPNNRIVTYRDATKDGTIAIYDNIVLEDGMTINALNGVSLSIEGETLGSEGNALIEFYMVAKDTGGANDYARAMINGEVTSNGGGRVYINACLAMGHLGDDTWDKGYTQ